MRTCLSLCVCVSSLWEVIQGGRCIFLQRRDSEEKGSGHKGRVRGDTEKIQGSKVLNLRPCGMSVCRILIRYASCSG